MFFLNLEQTRSLKISALHFEMRDYIVNPLHFEMHDPIALTYIFKQFPFQQCPRAIF
jgi:hypothetical protein